MNSRQAKTNPQLQNLKQMPQLQPLNLEQLDNIAGGCGCKSTFERSKPHVNVSG